jgi:hypothetical protein
MNSKIPLAFIFGALLASGIVYVAVRQESPRSFTAAAPLKADPPAQEPPAAETPSMTPSLPPDEPVRTTAKPAPVRARREKEVAQATLPPVPEHQPSAPVQPPDPTPAPAPAPAPVEEAPPVPAPPAPMPTESAPPPPVVPLPPAPSVTLQPGTMIAIRVGETISTRKNQPGDTFLATLSQPIVADGFVIAERGARAEGRIVELERAGKVKGVAHMAVQLTKITTSDGQHVKVSTASFIKDGPTSTGTDAAKVGGGAALGAIIGAIAGGGKGAGIGAGVGGAAGAGDVLMTRGKDAVIPVETKLSFRVQEAVSITERPR